MTPESKPTPPESTEEAVRPHVYDGIREYNKRLPNWWLATFYGAIIFSVGYWACYEWWKVLPDQAADVKREMNEVEVAKLSAVKSFDDESLWKMSRNPTFVEAGRATYATQCASCHLPSLRGKAESPAAIGASLLGTKWIYGGKPVDLVNVVAKGTARGMPPWGPVLGTKRITEVVAFVLSHHEPGEPIEIVNSPAAGVK